MWEIIWTIPNKQQMIRNVKTKEYKLLQLEKYASTVERKPNLVVVGEIHREIGYETLDKYQELLLESELTDKHIIVEE